MYEFTLMNTNTKEERYAFGVTVLDACKRAKLNPAEWQVVDYEYAD